MKHLDKVVRVNWARPQITRALVIATENIYLKNKKKGVNKIMALPEFFMESDSNFAPTATVGSFNGVNSASSFENIFEEACANFRQANRQDFTDAFLTPTVLKNPTIVAGFKNNLLSQLHDDVNAFEEDAGHAASLYDQVSTLFDNKVEQLITESANIGALMPIKTIDFPLLVKNQIKRSFKDVVNEEVTPSPIVKKRIEHTLVYDKKNPAKTWEYPQCFYNGDFVEMMKAGQGVSLDTKAVSLPMFNVNIVETLTSAAVAATQRIVMDITIDKVEDKDGNVITLFTPMQVNLADGAWVGGKIEQKYKATTGDHAGDELTIKDILTGFMDWDTNTCTLTSANSGDDGVKKVHFSGKLSNEGNEHALRTRYVQEDKEWKVGEGTKVDASYTLEELQEHKALLNMDMYQKSYNDLVNLLSDMEDSDGYNFLDDQFKRYDGIELDPLGWNPMVLKTTFDCDSTIATVALQSEYIAKELKFKIDRFVIDIADTTKLDNMNFVIWGNPRYISLLDPYVKWVFRQGDSIGGVKLDYSYGVMTSGDVKIYVVSSKKINHKEHPALRLLPFVTDNQTITFKRYKFSTDVVTSDKSAYKDTERAGGSQTYVWGASRYVDVALQAIQGEVGFENAKFITALP